MLTKVWVTAPQSNIEAVPWARLMRPELIAESRSRRSGGIPSDTASGTPSEDTTAACPTSGTRSVKSVMSQLRSCTWLLA